MGPDDKYNKYRHPLDSKRAITHINASYYSYRSYFLTSEMCDLTVKIYKRKLTWLLEIGWQNPLIVCKCVCVCVCVCV